MTLKWSKSVVPTAMTVILLIICFSCGRKKNKNDFSQHPLGYHWKLLAFSSDSAIYLNGKTARVNAIFCTQNDSVFYDSRHDLRDRFFVKIDTVNNTNKLRHVISRCNKGDSLCVLIPVKDFFNEQFGTEIPFFSEQDSVVKIYLRVMDILSEEAYSETTTNILNNENEEIKNYFGSEEKMKAAKDSLGFYWVERPPSLNGENIHSGDLISLSYEGAFLDGRIVDVSPANFSINYGTPDQIIKGLNYVISRLKLGQDSKIILPSQLAFGEQGSSNGSIAPFTPMLYKISITTKK